MNASCPDCGYKYLSLYIQPWSSKPVHEKYLRCTNCCIDIYKDENKIMSSSQLAQLISRIEAMLGPVLKTNGRHRDTYLLDNVVVKVPRNIGGMIANEQEYELQDTLEFPTASCEIFYEQGVPVLMMEKLTGIFGTDDDEKVEHLFEDNDWLEEFLGFDGPQVGFNERGRLVAYDYSQI